MLKTEIYHVCMISTPVMTVYSARSKDGSGRVLLQVR